MRIEGKIAYIDGSDVEIIIPDGVEEIRRGEISRPDRFGSIALTKIAIPKSVKKLEYFFRFCQCLRLVVFEGTIEEYFQIDMNEEGTPLHNGAKLFVRNKDGNLEEVKELHLPTELNRYSYSDFKSVNKIYLHHDTSVIFAGVSKCWNCKEIYYDGTKEDFLNNKVVSALVNKLKSAKFFVKDDKGEYVQFNKSEINSQPAELKEGTTAIEVGLYDLKNLEKLIIPSSVKEFKKNCFKSTAIKELYYDGTIDEWVQIKTNGTYSVPTKKIKKFFVKENGKYVLLKNVVLNVDELNDLAIYGLDFDTLDISKVKKVSRDAIGQCTIRSIIINRTQIDLFSDFGHIPLQKITFEKYFIDDQLSSIKEKCLEDKKFALSFYSFNLSHKVYLKNNGVYERVHFSKGFLLNYSDINKLLNITIPDFMELKPYNPDLPKAILCSRKIVVFYEKPFSKLSQEERENIFAHETVSFVTDDTIIFRGLNNSKFRVVSTKFDEISINNDKCVMKDDVLISYKSGIEANVVFDSSIKGIKADAFAGISYVLISFNGTIEQCLDIFEKPSKPDLFIIYCKDGVIQFLEKEIDHKKSQRDLCYFFCYHGIKYLTDNAIVEHDFYKFLERRFSVIWIYSMEIVSYSDDVVTIYNDDGGPDEEYSILDIDNFLKITEIDYENG